MKTNYDEHLAWFEHSVKPHVMTQHPDKTRCWHATSKKPAITYELMRGDSYYGKEDTPQVLSNPRKRQRVEDSPFLTTMEDEAETDDLESFTLLEEDLLSIESSVSSPFLTTMMPDEAITFDNEFQDHISMVEVDDSIKHVSSNNIPVRNMSESTLYYDAQDDWDMDDDNHTEQPLQSPSPTPSVMTRRDEIEYALHKHFRLKSFIPNQYEAITAALDEKDVFVVLPSGPPRNICYQLPVIFQHPHLTTVIIVPTLLYLLKLDDHTVDHHHIPTAFVSKSKTASKKNWISRQQLNLEYIKDKQLLYITFDDFSKCKCIIEQLYNKNLLARFVIEEAHCLSQWGEDFYFGYLRITETLKTTYPTIPITALTAIPNERIHIDVMNNLSIQNSCKIFKKSILL